MEGRWTSAAIALSAGIGLFAGCSSTRVAAEDGVQPVLRKVLWDSDMGADRTADSLWPLFARALQRKQVVRVEFAGREGESDGSEPVRPAPAPGRRHGGGGGMPGGGPPAGFDPPGGGAPRTRMPRPEEGAAASPSEAFGVAATLERWNLRDTADTTAVDSARFSLRLVLFPGGRTAWRDEYGCSSPARRRIVPEYGPVRPACLEALLDRAAGDASERARAIVHRLRHPEEGS